MLSQLPHIHEKSCQNKQSGHYRVPVFDPSIGINSKRHRKQFSGSHRQNKTPSSSTASITLIAARNSPLLSVSIMSTSQVDPDRRCQLNCKIALASLSKANLSTAFLMNGSVRCVIFFNAICNWIVKMVEQIFEFGWNTVGRLFGRMYSRVTRKIVNFGKSGTIH